LRLKGVQLAYSPLSSISSSAELASFEEVPCPWVTLLCVDYASESISGTLMLTSEFFLFFNPAC
jgi:hypothetical protein